MVKVVGIVRFFSILLFVGTLALVYAYLPLSVKLLPADDSLQVDKATFFYGVASVFLLVNVVFAVIGRMLEKPLRQTSEDLFAWFKVGNPALNIYIALLVGFVGVINNPLHISASSYAYLNWLGPIVLVLWIGGFLNASLRAKRVASEG